MKKVLLSCMMLLGLGVSVCADEIKQYVPGESFTKVSDLKENVFAMVLGNKALYVKDAQNLGFDDFSKAFSSTSAAVYFKLIDMPADAGEELNDYYLIRTYNLKGEEYHTWGNPDNGFLNSQSATGWCSFVISAGANGHKYGQDIDNGAVWDVQYVEGEGFTLKNVGTGLYLNNAGTANNDSPAYWNFCTLAEESVENPIEPGTYDATDANTSFFADFKTISEDATWDAEAKVFTKTCGWQWDDEGADFSQYRYLVITTSNSRDQAGDGKMSIKDNSGNVVSGDDYGEDYQNMWFSTWNHLFCCKIDLEKLRAEKMFDLHHVKELTIDGGSHFGMGVAYATNTEPVVRNRWGQNDEGSFRLKDIDPDKFGTICLPYQAAVACAQVYEIASASDYGITLVELNGLMEAGKPYIYKKNPNEVVSWVDNGNTNYTANTIYFYQASAATAESPVANNGLVGTFEATTAPEGSLVLSNNSLYTVDSDVTIGANKAWIDPTAVTSTSRGTVFLSFGEVTGIKAANVVETLNDSKVFDLQGREVAQPKKGVYLVSGKKVVIK